MRSKFTFRQKKAMKRLFELQSGHPDWPYGYLPKSVGSLNAAACRTPEMQASGMVVIDRIAGNCFRYRLSAAGMAFAEFLSDRQQPSPSSGS